MFRRDFLKIASSLSLFGCFNSQNYHNSEYQSLLSRAEKSSRIDPVLGVVPLKLYNYQKNMLRQICENDKVIFVNARQTGKSTVLNLYKDHFMGEKMTSRRPYSIRTALVKRHQSYHSYHSLETYDDTIVGDEVNFWDQKTFKGIIENNQNSKKKIIFAGSVDPQGNMKWAVEHAKKYGFKVFTYTIYDCWDEWPHCKVESFKEYKGVAGSKYWAEEMECVL